MQQKAVDTWSEPFGQRRCNISTASAQVHVDDYTSLALHCINVAQTAAKSYSKDQHALVINDKKNRAGKMPAQKSGYLPKTVNHQIPNRHIYRNLNDNYYQVIIGFFFYFFHISLFSSGVGQFSALPSLNFWQLNRPLS
ncbi:hypothetical protein FJ444_00750 [Aestuariibacter sp. GS-14]|uniref:hypothetical protein n=1 Tax=Aestuariibacter sp. GS-14 TaxID=2590670 RepID=UPI00112A04CD|nr:hypothetical protein [Aestuariibacter sp. GS-14]TPV61834.1 hypothetical protein FJ444_00750 [Aestuariibacter sp. GS-14]